MVEICCSRLSIYLGGLKVFAGERKGKERKGEGWGEVRGIR